MKSPTITTKLRGFFKSNVSNIFYKSQKKPNKNKKTKQKNMKTKLYRLIQIFGNAQRKTTKFFFPNFLKNRINLLQTKGLIYLTCKIYNFLRKNHNKFT